MIGEVGEEEQTQQQPEPTEQGLCAEEEAARLEELFARERRKLER